MESTSSLHPLVACAPLLGLAALVLFHVALTHLTNGKMHLSSLALAFAAGLLTAEGVVFVGIHKMDFFSGESPLPLFVCVAVAVAALGYGYFTFVNLNTTSLRIRILRELLHSRDKADDLDSPLADYDAGTITNARLKRLSAWKQIDIKGGRITLRKHAFWLLAGIIQVVRGILLPSKHLAALASTKSAFRRKKILCGLLCLLAAGALASFYKIGIACELDHDVTERTRYHSIPVALAEISQGASHDYTSYKSIAFPFQGLESIDKYMEMATSHSLTEPERNDTYFWLADDRGFSDLIDLSFRMFGISIKAIYDGYFLLIVLSVLFAILTLRTDPMGLSIIVLFICAYGSYLPELLSVTSMGGAALTNHRVHLSETRTMEIVGLVIVIQIFCAIIRGLRFDSLALVGVAGQALLFGFLLSCRSSLGWLFLALFFPSCLLCGYLLHTASKRSSRPFRSLVWAVLGIAAAFAGFQTVRAWHMLAENPYYLSSAGSRTVFHNALMGLCKTPRLREMLELPDLISDRGAIDSVNKWLSSSGRAVHDPTQLLNALGGHGNANWREYEADAKALYLTVWRKVPLTMLQHYGARFLDSLAESRRSMARKIVSTASLKSSTTHPSPFAMPWLLLAVVPIIVLSRHPRQNWIALSALVFALFFALIPSTAFYVAALTTTGASVLMRIVCYLVASLVFGGLVSLLRRRQSFNVPVAVGCIVGIGFLCAILIQHPIR